MKKPKPAAPPECLHCELVGIIHRRYPQGMDPYEASEVLRCLAVVAADILIHGASGSLEAFIITIQQSALHDRHQFKIIDRTKH